MDTQDPVEVETKGMRWVQGKECLVSHNTGTCGDAQRAAQSLSRSSLPTACARLLAATLRRTSLAVQAPGVWLLIWRPRKGAFVKWGSTCRASGPSQQGATFTDLGIQPTGGNQKTWLSLPPLVPWRPPSSCTLPCPAPPCSLRVAGPCCSCWPTIPGCRLWCSGRSRVQAAEMLEDLAFPGCALCLKSPRLPAPQGW